MCKRTDREMLVSSPRIIGIIAAIVWAAGSADPSSEADPHEAGAISGTIAATHVVLVKTATVGGRKCPTAVEPSNPCPGNPTALCIKPREHVRFEADDGDPLLVFWKGNHPMSSCTTDESRAGTVCRIKNSAVPPGKTEQAYEYGVARSRCPALDPRVIVKL